ncbi:MAG: hypothetical protein ABIQ57_17995, partial [Candidatus Kapaibacterium sp.]
DNATFRLLATFDDQHFGVYYQYNDEGQLVRKLRETERGRRTVQETQYHTPRVSRSFAGDVANGGFSRAHDELPLSSAKGVGDASGSPAVSTNVPLLSIGLGRNQRKVKIFGSDSLSIDDLKSKIPAFNGITLPDAQKLKFLGDLKRMDQRIADIEKEGEKKLSEDEEGERRKALEVARAERLEMIHRAGINEAQLRDIYRSLDELGKKDGQVYQGRGE